MFKRVQGVKGSRIQEKKKITGFFLLDFYIVEMRTYKSGKTTKNKTLGPSNPRTLWIQKVAEDFILLTKRLSFSSSTR